MSANTERGPRAGETRPVLLDLFCGAGGAAAGYHQAGFDVVGVDLHPQKNYPYEFRQDDALDFLRAMLEMDDKPRFDAVHASPPCQGYSDMSNCRPGLAEQYPLLIAPLRELLNELGLPYVIENVEAARPHMKDPITLCGWSFGREMVRHRLFECSFRVPEPDHKPHLKPTSRAGHWEPGTAISVAGHCHPIALAREVMGIDWTTREELAEAIPPYYTEYVGRHLMVHLWWAAPRTQHRINHDGSCICGLSGYDLRAINQAENATLDLIARVTRSGRGTEEAHHG